MQNFNYNIPTKIFFWKWQIKNLASQIKPFWNKVLLVYGKWSIKKSWLYDEVVQILKKNQIKIFELGNVEPNPDIKSVREGVKICKENQINFILAVGGWSVIDCWKAVALATYYDGDARDIFQGKWKCKKSIPIWTILTLSATGSEMNPYTVISNREISEKCDFGHISLYPKFSILDPQYTFSVDKHQTIAWIVDTMSHVLEQYFSTEECFINYRISEAILKTCIHYWPIALKEPENYEARAELMWASSLALNGMIGYWKTNDWATHHIEHQVSAIYNIAHGDWLAVLFPNWMKYVLDKNSKNNFILNKFCDFTTNVWDIPNNGSLFDKVDKEFPVCGTAKLFVEKQENLKLANLWIEKLREFWDSIWAPNKLSDLWIDEKNIEKMAEMSTKDWEIGNFMKLGKKDVLEILYMSL